VVFVESPVSGGVLRTARRDIALLCGCREAAMIDPLRPVLDAIAKRIFVFGSARHASVAKLVNNVAAVNIALGTIEALSLGVGSGLELEDLFEVLDAGTAGSYVLSSTLTRSLLDGDLRTGFAMRLAAKDMGLALDHAAFVDVDLPHTTESLTQLDEGIEGGLGDLVFPAVALRRGLRPSTDREVTAA
jgi:3-hydroxyisobutyrate dehydrogenase-like beta-hydroxyacid dehydrogenase